MFTDCPIQHLQMAKNAQPIDLVKAHLFDITANILI